MHKHFETIAARIFRKEAYSDVSIADISSFIEQNPYAPIGHVLLAEKTKKQNTAADNSAEKAMLYANDPMWINYLLQYTAPAPQIIPRTEKINETENTSAAPPVVPDSEKPGDEEPAIKEVQITNVQVHAAEDLPLPPTEQLAPPAVDAPKVAEEELLFEPYHTIDYFASQGIKLKGEELEKDRFGKQLKSFTEWLKTMKKVQPAAVAITKEKEAAPVDPEIEENASASIQNEEVLTEAMAEVWLKQGNKQKAIQIYQKLSLQNPSKNGYFASKISQIKVS